MIESLSQTKQQEAMFPRLLLTCPTFYKERVALDKLDNVFKTFLPIFIDRASRHISCCVTLNTLACFRYTILKFSVGAFLKIAIIDLHGFNY